jgi:Uncharacterized protein conserved in bacteria (DUF2330)
MVPRLLLALSLPAMLLPLGSPPAPACCPAGPKGIPVVNADQTVIILWDSTNKIEHFIRKASFKSEADDFGFLVPTPSQLELEESGDGAFPYLLQMTGPEIKTIMKPNFWMACTCSKKSEMTKSEAKSGVTVLAEKVVAGFKAAVLEANSAEALVAWLKENGYAYSPQIEAWAKPYVEQTWKFIALKVAKDKDGHADKNLTASSLRISFKTDTPLFPYREPDTRSYADVLNARSRLLRFYFVADARYQGNLTKELPWTGKVAWAGRVDAADRAKTLAFLKLPENTGPAQWFLTEFEDPWPYQVAPADITFSRAADQSDVRRPPIIRYVYWPVDVTALALGAVLLVLVIRHFRRAR